MNASRLKPESHVIKAQRFTIQAALDSIPVVRDPQAVTDVVFQVGFNDFRDFAFNAEEIQEKTLDMQLKYNQHFPNARQHLTQLPPLDKGFNNVNLLIQKLAAFTQSNLISTKDFRDQRTGNIRSNLMEDRIHYSEDWGVKVLSKAIKKSLYAVSNVGSNHLETMRRMRISSA